MKKLFRAGDTVKLKTGGPTMVVVKYGMKTDTEQTSEEQISKTVCVSWVEGKRLKPGKYQEAMLERVN